MSRIEVLAAVAFVLVSPAAAAAAPTPLPMPNVIERLGQPLDPALSFTDQHGRHVALGSLLEADRPLLVTLNYFRCRTLCDLQLQRLTQSLRALGGLPGRAFRVLTVSIDPTDTAGAAAERRSRYLEQIGRRDLDWRFLVGAEPQIRALAAQLGFVYRYDERSRQYAHVPMVFVVSPQGRIVRYLYGLDASPTDLRLALVDASQGKIGRTLDKLLLRCFEFDPAAGRYGMYVLGLVRAGGVITVLALVIGFVLLRRAEARHDG